MKILYKEPGKAPEIREIENDLKPMQELVGGYIETVRLGDDILIVCNEMGKFDCMDPNFYVEEFDSCQCRGPLSEKTGMHFGTGAKT